MRALISICLCLAVITGCAGKKKISRDDGPFDTRWPIPASDTESRYVSDDFDGHLQLLYEHKTKGAVNSPILLGGKYMAFNSTASRILIYNLETGHKVCQIKRRQGLMYDPVIFDDSLLTIVKRKPFGEVQLYNLFTGKDIEKRKVNQIRTGPIQVEENLIFGTTSGLIALSVPDLETVWSYSTQEIVDRTPLNDGNAVYFQSGRNEIYAVDAATGDEMWSHTSSADIISPITAGSHLYFSDSEDNLVAIDREDGHAVWTSPVGYPVRGHVAEADGKIYFGVNDGRVVCVAADDGAPVWEYQTDGIVTADPVVFGQAVIIGSHDRHLYSLDRESGQLIDRHRVEGAISESVAVDGDKVLAACRKNRIYCFEVNHVARN